MSDPTHGRVAPSDRSPSAVPPPDADGGRGHTLRTLAVSAVAWVLTAVLLILAWTGVRPEPTVDAETAGTIESQMGSAPEVGPSTPYPSVLLLVLAVLVFAAAAGLAARRRAARYPAVLSAVVSVVLLAVAGRWETLPAMVLLVVGTVALLTRSALREMH